MRYLKYIIALLCVFSNDLHAQTRIQKLDNAFKAFLADTQTKYATTSFVVLDAKTGQKIYAYNENLGVATASTLKNITAATAFYQLGKDFKYETKLAYTGNISADGTLKGNIVIIGSGDPTLGSDRFENTKELNILSTWANAVKSLGIKKIEGEVIADDLIFDSQTVPDGWIWQDLGNYYGAGTSGLSWRENQFDIFLKPGLALNQPVSVLKTEPLMPYLSLKNELKTGATGTGDKAYVYLAPNTNSGFIRGTWGLGIAKKSISASLPNPAYDAAYRLKETLSNLGIEIKGSINTTQQMAIGNQKLDSVKQVFSTIYSPSLSDMSFWFLKKSINLYGESFLKTIAIKAGKEPTTQNGLDVAINFWASKGIDKNSLNMKDGSGLSPGNRVTGLTMANILYQIQKEPWYNDFYKGLPEYNGMKIKSGTINDVSAFAGYHTNVHGNKYIISIAINNYSANGINKKLFKVLDALK